ncbi:LysR family transcriptional regulator [Sphingomonas carotinifaciens]|uniref:LysR family transcriptional regulator n=1 Tax=Sphingomonas carotinifaciens TaxID=1166323 RepID=A0A1G7M0X5_9SPHN|nr:LysR family transcriptional regulator [Sphingomonas carotinifaciens]MBB4086977.1 DNA-binding transcriptional LysR family regulator [Sphingomonas carotinifaciens]MWC42169.1 LysR family transcriptional regulator [Sphingomonas carotinifaciens]SDF54829.1 transcriptional regulator, LysR family [Sphingomonas carotinifaciens]
MIDPRLLRTFLAVCREGSISGAARRLNISQPSVSVAIGQLEHALGGSLFDRGRRGIVLTAAGIALFERSERMDALLCEAEEAVKLARRGVAGPLRIGGTPGALVSLVPAALGRMEQGGHVAVQVLEGSDAHLADLLRRGEIEVAVVTTGIEPPPEDIVERSIARDPFALIVGRAHDTLGPSVALHEIAGMPWVLPHAGGAFRRQIEALFLSAEVPLPLNVIRCDSLLTSKEIVRRSQRVTVLPRGVVAAELSMGLLRALPIEGAAITRNIGIRMLAERSLSDIGRVFVEAILKATEA